MIRVWQTLVLAWRAVALTVSVAGMAPGARCRAEVAPDRLLYVRAFVGLKACCPASPGRCLYHGVPLHVHLCCPGSRSRTTGLAPDAATPAPMPLLLHPPRALHHYRDQLQLPTS